MPSPSTVTPRATPAGLAAVGLVCALALAGCSSGSSGSAGKSAAGGGGAKATVTVTDASGKQVKVPAAPQRVVVLSEMDLDSALALGVQPVGMTAGRGQDGAPAYLSDRAGGITLVGAVTGPDIEKVVKARPDVILAGELPDQQVLNQLGRIAPTVVTIGKDKDWKKSLDLTGRVLGRQNEAKTFLAGYEAKVTEVKAALGSRAGVSVSVARYAPKGTSVLQQGLFISDVLRDLGFKRPGIQSEQGQGHSTPISDENLAQIDGDWLFIGQLPPGAPGELLGELDKQPAFQQLNAVKESHVTEVDGSKWTSLGGPLAAMSVLDDIRKAMAK